MWGRRVGWVFAIAVIGAACGTVTPTVEPSATPEVTSPPPPTALPVASLIEGLAVTPNVAQVKADIQAAFDAHPDAVLGMFTAQVALNFWQYCQTGDPSLAGDLGANREFNCEEFARVMYQEEYLRIGDVAFYDIAKAVCDYALSTLPAYQVGIFKYNVGRF